VKNEGNFFFFALRADESELHTSMRYLQHGSVELELNPPFQNPGSATGHHWMKE